LQGFSVNPHVKLKTNEKRAIRNLHEQKKLELIRSHRKFLIRNFEKIENKSLNGDEIKPSKIDLELMEVKPNSVMAVFFLWWNLVWWSLPYTHPIGRQMRFILWDRYHDAPFGLFLLQSPPLRSSARDTRLGLNKDNVDYWINQSMYAQRVGALPPYNHLLGAKMVALSLTSNEVRDGYAKKYWKKETLLKKRVLPNRLLFITTTSAYGKSSVYERIKYKGDIVSEFIGFTAGSGTFHIPQQLYEEMLMFLEAEGFNVKRGYGTGPSRKLKLISLAFRKLDLPNATFHNIRRGYYLFSNVRNLLEIIHKGKDPDWYDRPFGNLSSFWKKRWCIPRGKRTKSWKEFDNQDYFAYVRKMLSQ
jgi:hypothetical protein